MKHIALAVLGLICIGCQTQPPGPDTEAHFVGTYSVSATANGKSGPLQLVLTLKEDKSWTMQDALVGYSGTWVLKPDLTLSLLQFEGPSGKTENPIKMILKPSPDRTLLKWDMGRNSMMEFRFNPKAKGEAEGMMKQAPSK